MDVFLIPIGGRRYQLYCEVGDARPAHEAGQAAALRGWRQRLAHWFSTLVARVEEARHGASARRAARAPRRIGRRVKDRAICWLAEKIAEQRLLWHLRGRRDASLHFPADLDGADANAERVRILRADARRHLLWLVPDGLLFAFFGLLLTPIPGPNLLGYYFAFRVGGHVLSWLGARHGLQRVAWALQPCDALTDLRRAIALEPERRRPCVAEISARLHLPHLPAFVERVVVSTP